MLNPLSLLLIRFARRPSVDMCMSLQYTCFYQFALNFEIFSTTLLFSYFGPTLLALRMNGYYIFRFLPISSASLVDVVDVVVVASLNFDTDDSFVSSGI